MSKVKFFYKILIIFSNLNWIKMLFKGVAPNIEVINLLPKDKINTIIDVGSNKGQFILLSKKFYPNCTIYSIEPITEIFNKLKKNFENYNKIKFYNLALGNKNTIKKIFITKRQDSSSILKPRKNIHTSYNLINNQKIKIIKSSEILTNHQIKKKILVKIDVQGYEIEVLKGFGKKIKNINYILIEVTKGKIYKKQPSYVEIYKFLKKKNFKQKSYTKWERLFNSNIYQKDVLFENFKPISDID